MGASRAVVLVVVAGVVDCARPAMPPYEDALPTPILHLADHRDIPPDELGALGAPGAGADAVSTPPDASAATSARDASVAPLASTASSAASPAARCAPPKAPPPAPPARTATHRLRSGPPITNHIPPELIMRPIRARAACFRACYEAALATSPDLRGRVVVHFVVEEDGWVRAATVGAGTDLPDADAAKCVAAQFVGLAYPSPEGGRVQVYYPVTFEP